LIPRQLAAGFFIRGIAQQVKISTTTSTQINAYEPSLLNQAKVVIRMAQTSFEYWAASLLDVLDTRPLL